MPIDAVWRAVEAGASLAPSARFRKKYGTKGADGDYHLPLPPKGHPLAKVFARAVLRRAGQTTALPADKIAAVVKRAKSILHGSAAPGKAATEAESAAASMMHNGGGTYRRTKEDAGGTPHGFTEPVAGDDHQRRVEEAYVPGLPGSAEQIQDAILKAAQQSDAFGGPCVDYPGDPARPDAPRPYDISIVATFPEKHQVVISNSKSGEMWSTDYSVDADDDENVDIENITFANIKPVVASFTPAAGESDTLDDDESANGTVNMDPIRTMAAASKRAQAIIKAARESGATVLPRHMPVHLKLKIREAAAANPDGTQPFIVMQEGPGNELDQQYYLRASLESLVPLLNGSRSFFDHQTPQEEVQRRGVRSVRDLAGWWSDTRVLESYTDPTTKKTAPALSALFHPRSGNDEVQSLLRTAREHSAVFPEKAPFVAASVNGFAVGKDGVSPGGEPKFLMDRFTALMSVDLVASAGAGGRPIYRNAVKESASMAVQGAKVQESNAWVKAADALDLRTDGEKQKDRARVLESARSAARTAALNGKLGKQVRESAAVAADVKPEALTAEQAGKVDAILGIDTDEFAAAALKGAGETTAPTVVIDETEEAQAETTLADLSDEQIEKMSVEELKALIKAAKPGEIARKLKGDGAVQESAAVKKLTARVQTLEGEKEEGARKRVIEAAFEKFKVPEGDHQVILGRILESASHPDQVDNLVRAYKNTNMRERDSYGVTAVVRESGATELRKINALAK